MVAPGRSTTTARMRHAAASARIPFILPSCILGAHRKPEGIDPETSA